MSLVLEEGDQHVAFRPLRYRGAIPFAAIAVKQNCMGKNTYQMFAHHLLMCIYIVIRVGLYPGICFKVFSVYPLIWLFQYLYSGMNPIRERF